MPANTIAVAVIGGVTEELGGGKFANGAITAAFGYLYNQEATRESPPPARVALLGCENMGSYDRCTYQLQDRDGHPIRNCRCQVRENIDAIKANVDGKRVVPNYNPNRDPIYVGDDGIFYDNVGYERGLPRDTYDGPFEIVVLQSFTVYLRDDRDTSYSLSTQFEHRIRVDNRQVQDIGHSTRRR